jgi:branched-chain amino acid transport system substrate-binding protein
MNKKAIWFVIAIVVILIIVVLARGSSKQTSTGPIKVGVMVMLSGDAASWGENAKKGIDMAVEEYNAAHPDRLVETVYADTRSDARGTVSAFNKLVTLDHIQFAIGPLFQHELAAVDPLIQKSGIPDIAPGYYPREDRTNLKNPLLMWLDALIETDRIADHIIKQGTKSIAIIDSVDPWELAVGKEFERKMNEAGIKVLDHETIQSGAIDARLPVTKLISGKPEAVFLATYFQYVHTLKAIGEQQYKGKLYSIEIDEYLAGETKNFVKEVDVIGPEYYSSDFSAKFEKKYGTKAGMPVGHAYDAANLLLADLAKNPDPKAVMDDFKTRTSYEGVSGHIEFTPDGKTLFPTALFSIKDGVITRVSELK